MGKPMLLTDNMAPGIQLGPASAEGFGLYEPGLVPTMGVNVAQATPPGIAIDKTFDEVQAMAKPGLFDRPENWQDYMAVGAGLLGASPKKPQAPKAPEFRPPSLPPVPVSPAYMQGPTSVALWEEIMRRNGPLAMKLNIAKGGGM